MNSWHLDNPRRMVDAWVRVNYRKRAPIFSFGVVATLQDHADGSHAAHGGARTCTQKIRIDLKYWICQVEVVEIAKFSFPSVQSITESRGGVIGLQCSLACIVSNRRASSFNSGTPVRVYSPSVLYFFKKSFMLQVNQESVQPCRDIAPVEGVFDVGHKSGHDSSCRVRSIARSTNGSVEDTNTGRACLDSIETARSAMRFRTLLPVSTPRPTDRIVPNISLVQGAWRIWRGVRTPCARYTDHRVRDSDLWPSPSLPSESPPSPLTRHLEASPWWRRHRVLPRQARTGSAKALSGSQRVLGTT